MHEKLPLLDWPRLAPIVKADCSARPTIYAAPIVSKNWAVVGTGVVIMVTIRHNAKERKSFVGFCIFIVSEMMKQKGNVNITRCFLHIVKFNLKKWSGKLILPVVQKCLYHVKVECIMLNKAPRLEFITSWILVIALKFSKGVILTGWQNTNYELRK